MGCCCASKSSVQYLQQETKQLQDLANELQNKLDNTVKQQQKHEEQVQKDIAKTSTDLTSTIEKNASKLKDLGDDVDDAHKRITKEGAMRANLANGMHTQLSTMQKQVDSHDGKINGYDTRLSSVEVACSNVSASFDGVANYLTDTATKAMEMAATLRSVSP
eukprot:TRINITY_DN67821_c3_g3_i1.p2 TRINITY_DN67821_c3_g3~~TRINITY_DN67821_c3_g3_i1.p2  ORF type:complete len:162 (-),score=21.78 TRINITY_DN67821_c3_g3_i1:297-782(-)